MTGKDQHLVMMADDDEEDCFLASEALSESGARAIFSCVEDGMELLAHLSERSRFQTNGLPDLILLDLNMPRKDGRETLLEIKAEPTLKHIPVVILSTSKEERDISFAMNAGANSFIIKPASFEEWIDIMKSLTQHWLIS